MAFRDHQPQVTRLLPLDKLPQVVSLDSDQHLIPRKALRTSIKSHFWKISSTFGDRCPQNGSKNGETAPRTGTGCPHEGPSVDYVTRTSPLSACRDLSCPNPEPGSLPPNPRTPHSTPSTHRTTTPGCTRSRWSLLRSARGASF